MKQNTVGNYFRSIRALYNKAIKAKVVDRSLYPFHDITIKQQKTAKRAIGIDEMRAIVTADLKANSPSWDARNYFMLSFCLIGRLGGIILLDALMRSYEIASQSLGSIGVVVDPLDNEALAFYEKFGFISLPDSGKMFLPMDDIAQLDFH